MLIDIYYLKFSPPCRAVLMTAKQLNIDLNVKNVDLSKGQHLTEEYLKLNPGHTVPSIDDNGFILYESHAIMQYLCNRYAPNSSLYPKDPIQRALVDRCLCLVGNFFTLAKAAVGIPTFTNTPAPPMVLNAYNESLMLLESLVGDNKYLVGNNLTIADLSVLAITANFILWKKDTNLYPKLSAWYSKLSSELPYYKEVHDFKEGEIGEYLEKMKAFYNNKMMNQMK